MRKLRGLALACFLAAASPTALAYWEIALEGGSEASALTDFEEAASLNGFQLSSKTRITAFADRKTGRRAGVAKVFVEVRPGEGEKKVLYMSMTINDMNVVFAFGKSEREKEYLQGIAEALLKRGYQEKSPLQEK